jgi:hypothetical protein
LYFNHKKNLSLSMLICATWLFNSAWAGPPFVTDDPEPVKYQHWEVNYALTETWGDGTASAGVPIVDINYGATPNVQLHVQPQYSYERTVTDRRFGVDDTQIGIKYRFLNIEQADSSFMVGVYPMLQVPTGDKSLGANRGQWQSFLPLWIQGNVEKWTMYGGSGYQINPGQGNQNSVYVGGVALYQATPFLQIGGEVFHVTPNVVDGNSTTSFNLGGVYNLSQDYNLLFSAGKGLNNFPSPNQLSIYSALQVLY